MFRENHGSKGRTARQWRGVIIYGWLLASVMPCAAWSATLGMMADNSGKHIRVFDAQTDFITLDITAMPGNATGDCAVSSDERLGFTTNSAQLISFIDLQPGQAIDLKQSSTPISNLGVDMTLSPDNRFLVSAGGGAIFQPLSVIDTQTRTEVATSTLFADHSSVEFCDDGTLLVTTMHGARYGTSYDNALYDATLDEQAQVIKAGNRLSSGAAPNNAACAPGSGAGVLLDRNGGLTSFTLPGLQAAQTIQLDSQAGISAVFNTRGNRLYVRTSHTIEAFDFDPHSGAMQRDWVRRVAESSSFFGMDQIAVNPQNGNLYVDGGSQLLILDPLSGDEFGAIPAGDATGICFARAEPEIIQPFAAAKNGQVTAPPP